MRRIFGLLAAAVLTVGGSLGVGPAALASAAPLGSVPTVHVGSTSVGAPTWWSTSASVPLTLQWAATTSVTAHWQLSGTFAEHAAVGRWYGTVTIPAGALEADIVVPLLPGRLLAIGHRYVVSVTSVDGGAAAPGSGRLEVRAIPRTRPLLDTAGRQTAVQPNEGRATVLVPVAAAGPSPKVRTFIYSTDSATGAVDTDYQPTSGTFTIPAGALTATVPVTVDGTTSGKRGVVIVVHVHDTARSYWFTGHVWLLPSDPLGWAPPPGAVPATGNAVYLQSDTGDFIGAGQTLLYTQANSVLSIVPTDSGVSASIQGDADWSFTFNQPVGSSPLQPEYLSGVGRYPFTTPGLTFYGDGRGCNTSSSDVKVDQVVRDSLGAIQQMTMRFVQHCEGGVPALHGFIRYVAHDPTAPPSPPPPTGFTWHPPTGSVPATGNYLYLQSASGDYIGQGATYLYTGGQFGVTTGASGVVASVPVSGASWWDVTMRPPIGEPELTAGLYANVERAPFDNPVFGGFDLSGSGRGCNTLVATYAVDSITWVGGSLRSISARFVQHCEGASAPPLYGAVRWSAPI